MKIKLLPIFCLVISSIAFSQELSVSASSGYNFGFAQGNMERNNFNKFVGAFNTSIDRQNKYSLGAGTSYNFNVNYSLKNSLGFALGVGYLKGKEQIGEYADWWDPNASFEITTYANILQFSGGVFYKVRFNKITIQPEIDVMVGITEMYFNQDQLWYGHSSYRYENRMSGNYYLGARFGLNLHYDLNQKFTLIGGVNLVCASYSPSRIRCISATQNDGKSQIPLYEYEQMGLYVKEPTYYSSQNRPYELKKQNFAASSIGFQFGIQYTLWKKSKKKEA